MDAQCPVQWNEAIHHGPGKRSYREPNLCNSYREPNLCNREKDNNTLDYQKSRSRFTRAFRAHRNECGMFCGTHTAFTVQVYFVVAPQVRVI
jgi:hypothetical protein